MELRAPRGTKDMLLDEALRWEYLERHASSVFSRYGYERIVTPAFEHTELFRRGIGEATEIVQKEMYTFKDKKGRSLTLRPEGTAPVGRAYLEHSLGRDGRLVKLYYTGPMYRYERPQAGRYREFWQVGIEAIGSNDPALDAEVIELCMSYFSEIGLSDLKLYLNSMGCSNCRIPYTDELRKYFSKERDKLCSDCERKAKDNPLRIFDCKKESCQKITEEAPRISDYWCDGCRSHFDLVKNYLKELDLDFIQKPTLVRGFDYYTKTTFEVESPHLGAQNALGGGGRYDGLVEEYGGKSTPAIGFALGAERVSMALGKEKQEAKKRTFVDVFVVLLSGDVRVSSMKLLKAIRGKGISADTDYQGRSLKAQMRLANKLGSKYVAILGPDELAKGVCKIKQMESGEEENVVIEKAPKRLSEELQRGVDK